MCAFASFCELHCAKCLLHLPCVFLAFVPAYMPPSRAIADGSEPSTSTCCTAGDRCTALQLASRKSPRIENAAPSAIRAIPSSGPFAINRLPPPLVCAGACACACVCVRVHLSVGTAETRLSMWLFMLINRRSCRCYCRVCLGGKAPTRIGKIGWGAAAFFCRAFVLCVLYTAERCEWCDRRRATHRFGCERRSGYLCTFVTLGHFMLRIPQHRVVAMDPPPHLRKTTAAATLCSDTAGTRPSVGPLFTGEQRVRRYCSTTEPTRTSKAIASVTRTTQHALTSATCRVEPRAVSPALDLCTSDVHAVCKLAMDFLLC